jgi:hypothetical protein
VALKKKWPHGPVSKAQWRWWGYQMSHHTPTGTRWGHMILERAERQKPGVAKIGHHTFHASYRSLPERRGGPSLTTLRGAVGKLSR